MTTYNRSDRRHWRHTLRLVAWRVNLLLAALVLAAVLLPSVASAAPACPGGVVDGRGRCVYVWRGATCVKVGGVVWCSTPQQVGEMQP